MSCILNKQSVEAELKGLEKLNYITNIRYANSIIELTFSFKSKDEHNYPYLVLLMKKNVEDHKPFNHEIIKNDLINKINVDKIIERFVGSFHWEEGSVYLSDFFEV